jgi:O-antigen/teichoic acid export membrane protein
VPIVVLMVAYAEEVLTLAAGPEFAEGAIALQLLAPFVLFSFANAVLWRIVLAARRDRLLLALAIGVLVLNVGLNVAFIPVYGLEAAATVTVVSEAIFCAGIAVAARRDQPLPNLRYAPVIAAAGAAMIAAVLLLSSLPAAGALAASAVYTGVILALPGTAREVLFDDLLPAARSAVRRRR